MGLRTITGSVYDLDINLSFHSLNSGLVLGISLHEEGRWTNGLRG